MSENTNASQSESEETRQPATQAGTGIPKARFDEVNERMKAAELKLADHEASAEAGRKAELEKKGEYEKLTSETQAKLDTAQAQAEKWKAYQASRRTALTAKLSEEDKVAFGELPLEQLEQLTERLENKTSVTVVSKSASSTPAGATLTRAAISAMTPVERRERAEEIHDYYNRLTQES
jgi:hypothetical protein